MAGVMNIIKFVTAGVGAKVLHLILIYQHCKLIKKKKIQKSKPEKWMSQQYRESSTTSFHNCNKKIKKHLGVYYTRLQLHVY